MGDRGYGSEWHRQLIADAADTVYVRVNGLSFSEDGEIEVQTTRDAATLEYVGPAAVERAYPKVAMSFSEHDDPDARLAAQFVSEHWGEIFNEINAMAGVSRPGPTAEFSEGELLRRRRAR